MVSRRKLLVGASTVGVFSTIAGCSGGGEQNESAQAENESEETDESENIEQEGTDQIGSDIFVQNVSFSYTFSGGLASVVEVTNNREQGSGAVEVNISMEAYDGETELGNATWTVVWYDQSDSRLDRETFNGQSFEATIAQQDPDLDAEAETASDEESN